VALTRVKKRDGREVPFDVDKIRAAIQKSMAAVGDEDPHFAAEVAGVVSMTLEGRHESGAGTLPSIEDIQDLVEQALVELGRASVAKAYILYRDRRAKVREALAVHRSNARPSLRAPLVHEAEAASTWSKGRIVAALMNEADLARDVAEEVAARVESRVFDASFKRISTGLVRELVDNELVELGLAGALKRQITYGVPAHDLRAILGTGDGALDPTRATSGEGFSERTTEARIAAEVLRRFSIDEVLDERAAERHLTGDFHWIDLARPHQPLSLAVPSELVSSAAPSPRAAFEALDEIVRLAKFASLGLVIENPAQLIAPLARDRRAGTSALGAWLVALSAAARGAERRIDLGSSGVRAVAVTNDLVREVAALASTPFVPRLFLDELELEALAESFPEREPDLERLLSTGRLIPTWSSDRESFAAPGCVRSERERGAIACVGAVALNLPRLAWRAGPWREDRFLELAADLVSDALGSLARGVGFQQATRGDRLGDLRCRSTVALVPVGLREALQLLGDGEVRPDQGARLLGFFADAAARLAESKRVVAHVTPFFGERAAARFAELDRDLPQKSQALLFEVGAAHARTASEAYSLGLRLSPAPGRGPWTAEAELVASLAVGALHPLPEDRSRGEHLGLYPSWRRFVALRRDPLPRVEFAPEPARSVVARELFDRDASRSPLSLEKN
jgi:hypothetical protein